MHYYISLIFTITSTLGGLVKIGGTFSIHVLTLQFSGIENVNTVRRKGLCKSSNVQTQMTNSNSKLLEIMPENVGFKKSPMIEVAQVVLVNYACNCNQL